jgi:hypothetical protein
MEHARHGGAHEQEGKVMYVKRCRNGARAGAARFTRAARAAGVSLIRDAEIEATAQMAGPS